MPTLPLGVRIVLLVVPLAMLPLATVGGVTYYFLETTVRTEAEAAYLRQLGNQARSVERAFADAGSVAHVLSDLPAIARLADARPVTDADRDAARRALAVGMPLSRSVSHVVVAARGGSPLLIAAAPGAPPAPFDAGVSGELGRRPPPLDEERVLVTTGRNASAVVMHPAGGPDAPLSLQVVVDLGQLMREGEAPASGTPASAWLLDADASVIARGSATPDEVPVAVLQAAVRHAVAAPGAIGGLAELEGYVAYAASTAPIADLRRPGGGPRPLYLVHLAQKLPLAERLNELRRMALFLAGVSLAFGLIGAGLLARSVVHPLNALLDMTKRIGEGRFDVRLQKIRDDEIGQLVEAFNAMASSMADYRDKLVRAETFAALGRVASTVAHEVRNPLNAMRGCIEYLQLKRPDDAVVQHHTGIIGEEIAELDAFVSDFLRATRIESPRLAPVDLAELLRSRLALHEHAAGKQGVRLSLTAPADLPCVTADPQQMGIVIENLLNNALDAMPSGGELRVAVVAQEARLLLTVSDTGSGIPASIQPSLFTPFFSTKSEGAGIGLAISRRIIEAHGGRLDFESSEQTGTTFRVELPMAAVGDDEISSMSS